MKKLSDALRVIRLHAAECFRMIADIFDEPHDPSYDDDIIEKMSERKRQKEAMEKLIEGSK